MERLQIMQDAFWQNQKIVVGLWVYRKFVSQLFVSGVLRCISTVQSLDQTAM